jgi:hypothetical protein|eukprot:COSAG02_NODE_3513_length_6629_cov_2.342266_9_plen_126_part_00
MAEPWKPTGEKLPTGEVPKDSMVVAPEVARQREAAFAAKRAAVLGQDERLREAARTGDVAMIEGWAPGDDAVNKPGQGGWTALHFAAREGGVVVRPRWPSAAASTTAPYGSRSLLARAAYLVRRY